MNNMSKSCCARNNRGTTSRYSDPNNPRKIREKNTGIKIGGKTELKKQSLLLLVQKHCSYEKVGLTFALGCVP